MKGFFTSRRFRQGSMATAITAVVAALIVVVNLVATALTDRYGLTLDLTPTKIFSITAETKEYLQGIDKDVVIYVLDREETFAGASEYYFQAVEVLKKYTLESPRIRLEFIDLDANPAFAQNYPSLQLSTSSILLTCGDKVRDVTPYDLYDIQSDQYGQSSQVTASKAEQVLTSAILAITGDKAINVAVISGHNEEDVSSFTTLLQNNNYLIGTVSLVTEEIDPVYSVAIIAAPARDYSEDELRRLDAFLKNGGQYGKTLLYLAPSEQTALPNLDAFLADWGVAVEPGIVYESNSGRYVPGNQYLAAVDFAEADYSAQVAAAQMIPLAAYARPLSTLFESKNGVTVTTLLQFSGTAGVAVSSEEIYEPSGNPIPYMTLSNTLTYEGTTPLQSQVLAVGSSAFVDGSFLGDANLANSEYMLNLLAGFTGKEDSVRIQSKSLAGTSLDITALQAIVIGVALAILLPLAVLISGLVIWARRRHR